ncbi:MAG: L,D-transpeptidase [Rhizobiaceae bacterium]
MKKLLVFLTFVVGLLSAPVMAAETTKSPVVKLATETSSYAGKKDKAYWTRVWYRKQAAKGIYYKNHTYGKKKYRSSKKRYTNRNLKKRSRVNKRKRVAKYTPTKRRIKRGGIVAKVNLTTQRMHVYKNGVHQYTWKVSSGRKGYRTPTGTWRVGRMHKEYYSRKYNNAPMPYSMFYSGGFAIHGTGAVSRLGRPASHGCVRLQTGNAAKLYSLMRKHGRGRVTVSY